MELVQNGYLKLEHPLPGYYPVMTPLMIAANNGITDMCKFILSSNAVDVNQRDPCGRTALHLACRNGHVDTIDYLTQHPNINLQAQTNQGDTPLMKACESGNYKALKMCLQR